MNFEAFLRTAEKNAWKLHGIEVFQDGRVIHRYEKIPDRRYPIYSATKTVTSTAVGIASAEGKFCIEKSVFDYLREDLPNGISEKQLADLKKITIKRLLSMSVKGYPFRPQGEDWLAFSLQFPLENVDKKCFAYSNISAYLVGAAVENAVGEHLMSYLEPRLWAPLRIAKPAYLDCPSGHFYGASGMELTVNEFSRLGQLYLQNGKFDGRRILPSSWVREATSIQQMNREGGYGYFIWKYKDGFRISGKWGQRCFVFPQRGRMITYLADMQQGSDDLVQAMEEYLL